MLRGILRLARRQGRYSRELSEVMPIAFDAQYTPRTRFLTPTELGALVDALLAPDNGDRVGGENRAAFVLFAVATGARLSEVRRARREDIDLVAGKVRLRGSKTAMASREVPVLPHTKPLLQRVLKLTEGRDGILFHPWQNNIRDLDVACAQAEIPKVTPNDLRRTYGKWLRLAGVPADLIGATMGHVDGRMVEKVYGKLTHEEAAAQLRQHLGTRPTVAILRIHSRHNRRNSGQPAAARH